LIIYDKSIDFRIPIKEIQNCELYDKPWTGAASGVNFRIKFSSGDVGKSQHKQTEEVYLCPSHVFKHRDDVDEMKAMLMVIESYRTGNVASIQKNPYHRQLIRQGQSERITEREWKPHLPPSHYSTAPSLKRFLTIAPLVFIAVMLTILITTAVIFYLVTKVF
jgi:hypothetical protein